jgi:hypothetical protein
MVSSYIKICKERKRRKKKRRKNKTRWLRFKNII